MSEYINETGARLAALRKEKGLTQKAVAERLGINEKSYTVWEVGRRKKSHKEGEKTRPEKEAVDISNAHLCALADLYGVSCDYILGRSPFQSIDGADIARITGLSDSALRMLSTCNNSEYPNYLSFIVSLLIDDYASTGANSLLDRTIEYITAWNDVKIQDADAGQNLPSFAVKADAINDLAWTFHRAGTALNRLRNAYLQGDASDQAQNSIKLSV